MLIRAFSRVLGEKLENGIGKPNGIVLLIAGPCEERAFLKRLKRLAADLYPSSSVLWPGMLTGDLKWGAFYAAEAFILPSHQENFGIAVVEALATGTPALVSKRVNIWREIEAEGAGHIDEDTLEGTVCLIKRWLSEDAHSWNERSRSAAQCFEKRFEIRQSVEKLIELFQSSIRALGYTQDQ